MNRRPALLGAGLLLALSAAGCAHHGPPLPIVVIPQPPILLPGPAIYPPMPPPDRLAPLDDAATVVWAANLAPDLDLQPPLRRVAEADRPRRDEPAPPAAAADQPPPQLSLGISPAQAAQARQQAQQRLAEVQRELVLLNARRLNPTDAATRAQVGEYARQAGEALDHGDWVRAQNLADKADTLARYLLGR